MDSIPLKLKRIVDKELQEGETIRWIAQPIAWKRFLSISPIWAFALPWNAVLIHTIPMLFQQEDEVGRMGILMIPLFILIGLLLFFAPFFVYYLARNTAYLITNKRVITFELLRTVDIISYFPKDLTIHEKKVSPDGTGDLIFHIDRWSDCEGSYTKKWGVKAVRDVYDVEKLICQLIETAKSNLPSHT